MKYQFTKCSSIVDTLENDSFYIEGQNCKEIFSKKLCFGLKFGFLGFLEAKNRCSCHKLGLKCTSFCHCCDCNDIRGCILEENDEKSDEQWKS